MKVPYVDIVAQYQAEPRVLEVIQEVLASGNFILGPQVEEFEAQFADLCGVDYAIAVSSGTDALFLALKALGIGEGDEVITVPNTFLSTVAAIATSGALPVLVDVGDDYNMDPDLLEAAITPRTRAIIPVHLTGRPARMEEINAIASHQGIKVIEDAAQAVDASINGIKTGNLGDMGAFSLHPLKNLTVPGDGGVITTSALENYQKLTLLRNHGLKNRNESVIFSYNCRLDTLKAAVALVFLEKLPEVTSARNRNAALYDEALADLSDQISIPVRIPEVREAFHTYVIQVEQRDRLMEFLAAGGVETKIHYPIPVHLMEACRNYGYREGDFPVAENQARKIISLPVHQHLSEAQLQYVINRIRSFYS